MTGRSVTGRSVTGRTVIQPSLRGGLMVCGTTSDSGKSTLVTGLCRLLARRGVKVAPFKGQNMALNSAVTPAGDEIGRAQAAQAQAAGVDAEVAMNPVLLKPNSDQTSQVVVLGRPWATLAAGEYQTRKSELWDIVVGQLEELRSRFDVVLCEGAGSPAEINLLGHDIVNLRVAAAAGLPAVVIADIERGGVFAALYGTVALLPDDLRDCVRGFVINKFRGDARLLAGGPEELQQRTGVPTLGVLPWMRDIGIDAEDSLALQRPWAARSDGASTIDVAVIRFPRIANFTDLDPLVAEPGVGVRIVHSPAALGRPDLLVLPGTKTTVDDLGWLRVSGLAEAIAELPPATTILGICGGYQMLGRAIDDRHGVESRQATAVDGLGLLAATTVFGPDKVTRAVYGTAFDQPVDGYFIHHGRTEPCEPWIDLAGQPEGSAARDGAVLGTSVHGLFESDPFRAAFLVDVAERAGKSWAESGVSFAAVRNARFDALADAIEEHLDIAAIERTIGEGAR